MATKPSNEVMKRIRIGCCLETPWDWRPLLAVEYESRSGDYTRKWLRGTKPHSADSHPSKDGSLLSLAPRRADNRRRKTKPALNAAN